MNSQNIPKADPARASAKASTVPAPWRTGDDGHGGMYIEGVDGTQVGYFSGNRWQAATAHHIVKCVNNHAELVAALRETLAWLENMDGTKIMLSLGNPDAARIVGVARSALSKVDA